MYFAVVSCSFYVINSRRREEVWLSGESMGAVYNTSTSTLGVLVSVDLTPDIFVLPKGRERERELALAVQGTVVGGHNKK